MLTGVDSAQERRESYSKGWRSKRERKIGERKRRLPASVAEKPPRCRWFQRSPVEFVWLLRVPSAAREDRSRLHGALRCFPDAWTRASKISRWFCRFWVRRGSQRPEGVSAAPQAGWVLLEGCWMTGEGFWAIELGFGGL